MNVLLTGGAGYIGSHIAVELLKAGHNVIIVDSFINSCSEVINRIKKISCKDIKLYVLDIKEKGLLRRVFGENHIDCVIHLAGLKAVGESINNPLIYYRNKLFFYLLIYFMKPLHPMGKPTRFYGQEL